MLLLFAITAAIVMNAFNVVGCAYGMIAPGCGVYVVGVTTSGSCLGGSCDLVVRNCVFSSSESLSLAVVCCRLCSSCRFQ
jgi:hypothetical protein